MSLISEIKSHPGLNIDKVNGELLVIGTPDNERELMQKLLDEHPDAMEEYKREIASNADIEFPPLEGESPTGDSVCFSGLDFIDAYPSLRTAVIDGLLREGEVGNVIGSTKEGKSWMILSAALSVAQGVPWLGREVQQGRVLLVDNELQPETLSFRIRKVAGAMNVPDDVLQDELTVISLRGHQRTADELWPLLEQYAGSVRLVCLDAFYRLIPSKVSENDNAAMTGIYGSIAKCAELMGCAFLLNHHSSKGNQTDKRVTDVGSGAGAISRYADTHLTIRDHNDPDLAVMEAALRSFPPVDPVSIRFDWPLWMTSSEEPELKQRATAGASNQAKKDQEADEAVKTILQEADDWMSRTRLIEKTGMGPTRVNRSLYRQRDDIEEEQRTHPKNKNATADYFRLKTRL